MKPMVLASPRVDVLIAIVVLAATACSREPAAGKERAACRPERPGTSACEAGLTCMSGLCVRPPPADCGEVAESLVSIELGNYAPADERAARLPAKRALCERLRVSRTEAECLAKTSDEWSAAACVPRMFPQAEAGDCEPVIAKLRAMIQREVGGDQSMDAMLQKVIGMLARSCVQDEWPEALRRCILAVPDDQLSKMNDCDRVMPEALKQKLQERMSKMNE